MKEIEAGTIIIQNYLFLYASTIHDTGGLPTVIILFYHPLPLPTLNKQKLHTTTTTKFWNHQLSLIPVYVTVKMSPSLTPP